MSSDAMIVNVTLSGISPMLHNRFTPELMEQIRTKKPGVKNRDQSPEQEATPKLYQDPKTGLFGIPVENLYASLAKAGQQVPLTKATDKISTATTTKLYSLMSIKEEFLPFDAEQQGWVVDMRRGRNPNGGEAVVLVRPKFETWTIRPTVELYGGCDSGKIQELFNIAGASVGLGDFRPGCKGPFGRSAVESWKPQGSKATTTATVDEPELAGV